MGLDEAVHEERIRQRKLLPILEGKVKTVLARKGQLNEKELSENHIQVSMDSARDCELLNDTFWFKTGALRSRAYIAQRYATLSGPLSQLSLQFDQVRFSYGDIISFAEIFALVDADGSGQISSQEVRHLMQLLGESVSLADIEGMITEFDLDGSGEVDLVEFLLVLAMQRRSEYNKQDVIRAFNLFAYDSGGSTRPGHIRKDALTESLKRYGGTLATEKEIVQLVDGLDIAEGTPNEFNYAKHANSYLS